ncbi:MAG: serine/threonine protein phosphatase [Ruminococcus sp.]|nr:serine/threonine protein phosphatase [Ruminococcus sp.]
MNILGRKKSAQKITANAERSFDNSLFRLAPHGSAVEYSLYDALRANLPIIDAAIGKIVRLTGGFRLKAEDQSVQPQLDRFAMEVPVGISGVSINTFADMYLDSLLTYGKAIAEILTDKNQRTVSGLWVADSTRFRIDTGPDKTDLRITHISDKNDTLLNTDRMLYTALNPSPRHPEGVSVLRGLPSLSNILMRIYECIGQNFDRVGNVRYAVTYNPSDDADKAFAKERAMEIAKEWSSGMNAAKSGNVKDFVAVGDVQIKVIGAENQLIDTEVPVRQLLEQLISKLSIPPFLLGLNWSSTERMSSQQADILTSELEYYRRLLTPVLRKIGLTFLRLNGIGCDVSVEWANINLQDEEALAKARLYNAQAEQIELLNQETKGGLC